MEYSINIKIYNMNDFGQIFSEKHNFFGYRWKIGDGETV